MENSREDILRLDGKVVVLTGGRCSVDEMLDLTGKTLDSDKFTSILKEYYGLRGWDEQKEPPGLKF